MRAMFGTGLAPSAVGYGAFARLPAVGVQRLHGLFSLRYDWTGRIMDQVYPLAEFNRELYISDP